ncbi:amino acid ABC transporter substrate-binding protein [Clostridium sp. Cult2]|uniref:amino acid ABC transporter substrate-binding protein n=1 Tax=Clostridium sp. Cult2 TaxID=2079003 RepID=UPI001F2A9696|nr:amino acid ABC transporter substrate-binding protein [Clostridium sp. Cult2]MCF6466060.1 amino acid ABC transporter substrate-binding protein [Clostridium sp. Cult2]
MKRNNCLIILLAVLILNIFGLTGCTKEVISKKDSYEKLEESGYIVMGLDDTFAPMGFRDDKGELVGFDVDLAKEVFKRAGFEVKFQPIDWSMKETELNSGNIDVIWNGYSINDERKEKVAFTQAYLENKQIIMTLADSNINSKTDLKDKKVAVQNGSSTLEAINKEPEVVESFEGGQAVLFDTNHEAIMDLEAGRVDAVISDEVLARYYISQKNPEDYKILKEDFGEEEYGIGLRKEDNKLLEVINNTLDEMKKDGSYDEIYKKWFGGNN